MRPKDLAGQSASSSDVRTFVVTGFTGVEHEIAGRPLRLETLCDLMNKAGGKEWYGNPHLIDFVVRNGLGGEECTDPDDVIEDFGAWVNTARQLWVLTLKGIAKTCRGLRNALGLSLDVPQPRHTSSQTWQRQG